MSRGKRYDFDCEACGGRVRVAIAADLIGRAKARCKQCNHLSSTAHLRKGEQEPTPAPKLAQRSKGRKKKKKSRPRTIFVYSFRCQICATAEEVRGVGPDDVDMSCPSCGYDNPVDQLVEIEQVPGPSEDDSRDSEVDPREQGLEAEDPDKQDLDEEDPDDDGLDEEDPDKQDLDEEDPDDDSLDEEDPDKQDLDKDEPDADGPDEEDHAREDLDPPGGDDTDERARERATFSFRCNCGAHLRIRWHLAADHFRARCVRCQRRHLFTPRGSDGDPVRTSRLALSQRGVAGGGIGALVFFILLTFALWSSGGSVAVYCGVAIVGLGIAAVGYWQSTEMEVHPERLAQVRVRRDSDQGDEYASALFVFLCECGHKIQIRDRKNMAKLRTVCVQCGKDHRVRDHLEARKAQRDDEIALQQKGDGGTEPVQGSQGLLIGSIAGLALALLMIPVSLNFFMLGPLLLFVIAPFVGLGAAVTGFISGWKSRKQSQDPVVRGIGVLLVLASGLLTVIWVFVSVAVILIYGLILLLTASIG